MPNWCKNVLTVSGNIDELNEFARYVASDEMVFDFEEIVPEPPFDYISSEGKDPLIGFKLEPGDHDWDYRMYCNSRDWACKFWGSIRNLYSNTHKEFIKGDLVYSFDTAWSPPVGIIRELARVFNNLVIKCEFAEPGCLFFGECGGIFGSYYEWDAEMTFKTHPVYWTYSCDECDHEFVHDGRVCPHCGYDENAETVST